ncbi:hypothetical protein [Clostridium sp. UBA4548]|uniref:hypothetical protein n=1 Tax=Clostridium sp. UBA4548 TaxID=1946361 RepID=UPI0025C358A0|nr:hypothetical protein [Clostridium sp. UBA4548]
MQAIMETLFDAIYLSSVIILGLQMIIKGKNNQYIKLFGYMSVLLGFGDAFHLVPRSYALLTTGLESHAGALGFGKFVTSITMTIFYVILYRIWELRFDIKNSTNLRAVIGVLAAIRIILCFFPQNQWFIYNSPISWGIYRNIPFAIMGIIMIYIMYREAVKHKDKDYKFMALAVFLSFALYIPVVLWGTIYRPVGILMIPKTLAYVWIVLIGYKHFKKELNNSKKVTSSAN